jgi:hypothetical protein
MGVLNDARPRRLAPNRHAGCPLGRVASAFAVGGRLSQCASTESVQALDQLKLGRPGKPLDPGLFAQRRGSIGDRDRSHELNRSAAARVAAGGAGTVRGQAPLEVRRPPAVERLVGTAEQVDEGHPYGFAGANAHTCPGLRFGGSVAASALRDVRKRWPAPARCLLVVQSGHLGTQDRDARKSR